jgi:hypothetical protein
MDNPTSNINNNVKKDSDNSSTREVSLKLSKDLVKEDIVSEIKYLPLQQDLKITFTEVYDKEVLYVLGDVTDRSKWIEKLESMVKRRIPKLIDNHYLLIKNDILDNLSLLYEILDNDSSSIAEQEVQENELKDDPARSFHDIFGEPYPEYEIQGTNDILNSNNTDITPASSDFIVSPIIDKHELRSKISGSDYIEYAIKMIKKTVKSDDTLIKQILYTGLSSYIQIDPINLGIISPTSEGKTYPVEECIKLFPKQDVYKIGSMSTKAFIRQKGILVDKDNQPLEPRLKELRKQLVSQKSNSEEKEKTAEQIKELNEDSRTLIDLNSKILVFLEPPQREVWETLKPILSHDSPEIEFPFVDKNEKYGLIQKRLLLGDGLLVFFAVPKMNQDGICGQR